MAQKKSKLLERLEAKEAKEAEEAQEKKRVPHNKGKKKDSQQPVEVVCACGCGTVFQVPYAKWRQAQGIAQKRGHEPRLFYDRKHYYQWQRQQKILEEGDPQRIVQVRCAGCGEYFNTTYELYRKGKKFCNDDCKKEFWKKKQRMREEELKQRERDSRVEKVYEVPYTPHPTQWEVHKSKARFKVLACLPPGEMIPGEYKPIEEVCIGDTVFGRSKLPEKVLDTMSREFNGHLIEINARYILPFRVTSEHPILISKVIRNDNFEAFKKGRRPKKTIWKVVETKWVEAGNLKDYLDQQDRYNKWCLHIPRLESGEDIREYTLRPLKCRFDHDKGMFPINEDTAWAMGLYIAEGCNSLGTIAYNLGKNEEDTLGAKLVNIFNGLGYHVGYRTYERDNTWRATISSTPLAELFELKFGKGAGNKRIPNEILMHPNVDIIKSFLRGYFDGDGYIDYSRGQVKAKTNSKVLALQLQLLIARLGFQASLRKVKRNPVGYIKGRKIHNRPAYTISVSSSAFGQLLGYPIADKHIREFGFMTDDVWLVPLSGIKEIPYSGLVYNLSTTDETFLINNVVGHNCGSRWGKDRCTINEFIMRFVDMLYEDRPDTLVPRVHGWIIAPTFPMARQIWRELKYFMPEELVMAKNEADKTMTTVMDGFIEVKSAEDPNSLVGVGLDIVTITEAARIKHLDEVWAFVRGRLTSPGRGPGGNGGVAFINSTPNVATGAYFRKLWLLGRDREKNPDWESFHFPTSTNPYIKPEEIEEARRTLPDRIFRQEFLAEFLEGEGAVFTNITKCAKGVIQEPAPNETYVIGFDPARAVDFSAVAVRDSKGQVVFLERYTGKPWTWQVNRVEMLAKRYNHAKVIMDRTGLGETLVEALAQRGVDVEGVFFTQAVKEQLVNHLAYLMEQEMICYPDESYLIDELTDYSYSVSPSGKISYGNKDGHDDAVTALMLCMRDFDIATQTLPFMGFLLGGQRKMA